MSIHTPSVNLLFCIEKLHQDALEYVIKLKQSPSWKGLPFWLVVNDTISKRCGIKNGSKPKSKSRCYLYGVVQSYFESLTLNNTMTRLQSSTGIHLAPWLLTSRVSRMDVGCASCQ